jgi:hypothetical protein
VSVALRAYGDDVPTRSKPYLANQKEGFFFELKAWFTVFLSSKWRVEVTYLHGDYKGDKRKEKKTKLRRR